MYTLYNFTVAKHGELMESSFTHSHSETVAIRKAYVQACHMLTWIEGLEIVRLLVNLKMLNPSQSNFDFDRILGIFSGNLEMKSNR